MFCEYSLTIAFLMFFLVNWMEYSKILKIPIHHMREQTKYSRRVSVRSILGLQRILAHILTPVLLLYAVLKCLRENNQWNQWSQTKCGGEGEKCVSGFYSKWRIVAKETWKQTRLRNEGKVSTTCLLNDASQVKAVVCHMNQRFNFKVIQSFFCRWFMLHCYFWKIFL